MGLRRVVVELLLNARNYLDESKVVEEQTKATERAVKDLGDKADGTSHDMSELAANTDVAKKEVAGLGDRTLTTAAALKALDARIEASKRNMRQLGLEYAATGDEIAGGKLGKERSLLGRLEALKKELSGGSGGILHDLDLANVGAKAGESFFSDFFSSAGRQFSAVGEGFAGTPVLGPIIAGAIIGAIVSALPVVAAMIGGAVAGGVAVGGIALGVLTAIHDPVVKSAFSQFADFAKAEFFGAGSAFIDPIRQGLAILEADLEKFDLAGVLAPLAPLVPILASGLGDFVLRLGPGLKKAFADAGPYVTIFAKDMALIGDDLGYFIAHITESKGALAGWDTLLKTVGQLLVGLGNIIAWLSDRFLNFLQFNSKILRAAADFADIMGANDIADHLRNQAIGFDELQQSGTAVIPTMKGVGDAFAGAGDSAGYFANRLSELNAATDTYISNSLALWSANINAAQAIADLSQKLIYGRQNWDLNTQAGRDNQRQLESTVQALDAQRQAAIKNSDGSVAAINAINQAFDDQLKKIEDIARQAGDTKAALDALEKTYHVNVIVDLKQTNQLNKANAIEDALSNAVGHRASGGPVGPGSWLVGENQPEVLTLGAGQYGTVSPSVGQWSAMANSASQQWLASSGSSPMPTVNLTVQMTDPITGSVTRQLLITDALNRNKSATVIAAAYP